MATIPWARSFDAAKRSARASKKLILIDFYTDWCTYCKKLDRDVFPNPQVIQAMGAVVPVRLHAEREGQSLAQQFGVSSYPTLLFLDEHGIEAGRISGFLPVGPFVVEVNSAVKTHRELPGRIARANANPGDTKAALELIKTYSGMRRTQPSEALLDRIQRTDPTNARGQLAEAANLVGEMNLQTAFVTKARRRFTLAEKVAKKPLDRAIALLNLGVCDAQERNLTRATAYWKRAKAIPGAPANVRQFAERLLQRAAELKSGGRR